MVNDLTAFDQLQQNDLGQPEAYKTDRVENRFGKGVVVFKKDTGMAFEICNVSYANGIEHFNLLCPETGSSAYLSKFALEKDYSHKDPASEKFGLRIVRRLSELSAK
ncbi:hypothetical protein N8Z70_01110 [Candidatus Puniceispirillum sp.]|nr:hypothetical protein [Candidatus Puniceispirillum sp.]